MELVSIDAPDHPLLPGVIGLGDRHRATLGFFPRPAFTDRAAAGTITAAVEGNTLLGYVMYDLPRDRIRLIHLCVADAARGKGLARRLVDDVERQHPERVEISLRCRRDFPAHNIWPRLGFVPVDEAPGRSLQGLPVTAWRRPVRERLSLFDFDASVGVDKLVAAVDTNVFLDLVDPSRPETDAMALTLDWLLEDVEVVHTDEVARELDGSHDAQQRQRSRATLLSYRRLPVGTAAAQHQLERLIAAMPSQLTDDRSLRDLRHVAFASAGGADYFVTRDDWLLNRVAPVAERACSLLVRSPAALALEVDRRRRTGAYAPGLLAKTVLRLEPITAERLEDVGSRFVSHAHGERRTVFVGRVRRLLSEARTWDGVLVVADGDPLGLCIWHEEPGRDEVAVLRVQTTSPLATTVARQLLYARRCARTRQGGGQLVVTDDRVTSAVEGALSSEGFIPTVEGHSCTVADFAGPTSECIRRLEAAGSGLGNLNDLDDGPLSSTQVAAIEERWWPLKVLDADIHNYMVPIKPVYAAELFDTGLAEQTLFPRQVHLGIAREHVYYRSPRGPRLATPARLLWYVSSEAGRQGSRSIRAVSRLVEVVVDEPTRLYERFRHLGVYELEDVKRVAKGGRAMALRFVDTERLPRPVHVSQLRRHAEEACHSLVFVSVHEVPPTLFAAVYREGTRGRRQP